MRFLMQGSGSVQPFGVGVVASVAAHAVLIGGAVLGTSTAGRTAPVPSTERVLYLLPRDRARTPPSPAPRVRYVVTGGDSPDGPPRSAAEAGRVATTTPEQARGAASSGAAPVTVRSEAPATAPGDSVFSMLTAAQSARVDESAAPIYPAALIEQRIEGSVQARYVVDTTGHADSRSVEILAASHPSFALAVREAVPHMRFTPATVDGRHVRQLVEQSFSFRLTDVVAPTAPDNTRAHPAP